MSRKSGYRFSEQDLRRRKILRGLLALVFTLALTGFASAADYPTRPVRLVVGFAPGGPTDILARHMAQYLASKLGQQFVVENKPGATGNIATEYVLGQPADGYTILVTTTANAIKVVKAAGIKGD